MYILKTVSQNTNVACLAEQSILENGLTAGTRILFSVADPHQLYGSGTLLYVFFYFYSHPYKGGGVKNIKRKLKGTVSREYIFI